MINLILEAAKEAGVDDLAAFESVLKDALARQRSPIEDLLDSNLMDEEKFLCALAKRTSFPWLNPLPPIKDITHLRAACGPRTALRHRLLPVSIEGEEEEGGGGKRLLLATYDPLNFIARQAALQSIDMPVKWCMGSRRQIINGLQKLYGLGADTFEQILEGRDLDFESLEQTDEANVIDEVDDDEASVVKFVNQIIREALEENATDIHVEPLPHNLRIRYRIDGQLVDVTVPDNIRALQSSVIARLKIMSKLDIAEKRLPQDGRINLQFEGETIDVRVATIPTVEGESVSLRLLNQQKFNIDRLGLEPFVKDKLVKLLKLSNGIILITGPTGSGKSTSLYSFLTELNSPETRIVTVEDPVENKLEGVMQIAVRSEIGLTFAAGLRSILRADPNIVMVGEIRDLETAEIAIRASLTGHLVFSTLHTNDALGGISRLVDMGVEPFLVSASVRAFLAQRLVRRLCPYCKAPHILEESERKRLGIPDSLSGQVYTPVGCDRCRHTGFAGRLALYEIVSLTPEMQDLISANAPGADLKVQAIRDGYVPMREYGWYKVMKGETTIEEVISVTATDISKETVENN